MKSAWPNRLFARKSVERLVGEAEQRTHLKRVLGPWSLVFLGLGATIGTGIYVLAGTAAREDAGPALVLSFMIAAVGCGFAALAYAELAGMVPVSGSAYTYAYATLGELFAWVIGWLLILEYSVSASAVAQGWSSYFADLWLWLTHLAIDPRLLKAPWDFDYDTGRFVSQAAYLNLPALLIVWLVTVFVVVGIKESARLNASILFVNLAVIAMVLVLGSTRVDPKNWTPFLHPGKGWGGVAAGAGLIFFAYIGFDATATYAEEARNPRRDIPIGILGSLAICTVLYIGMTLVLTGLVPAGSIDVKAPFASAFRARRLDWASGLIALGVLAATTNVILVGVTSQTRIFLAMARDGLLPSGIFATIDPRFHTPMRSTILIGGFVGLAAALAPLKLLANLVDIGTLTIFVIVCAAVVVLRRTRPDAQRTFRAPLLPVVAALGIVVNLGLMASIDWRYWLGLGVWLIIGICLYFAYGFRRSRTDAADSSDYKPLRN